MRQWNAVISLHVLLLPGTAVILRWLSPFFLLSIDFPFELSCVCKWHTCTKFVWYFLGSDRSCQEPARLHKNMSSSTESLTDSSEQCVLPMWNPMCPQDPYGDLPWRHQSFISVTRNRARDRRSMGDVFWKEEVEDPSWRKPAKNGCGWGKGLERREREGLEGDGQCDLLGCPDCN